MKRSRPEDEIQRAVFAHLRARAYPGVVAFHVPNGGLRSKTEASIMKGLGVMAGVPDVIAFMPTYYGAKVFALEIKANGGRLTEAQKYAQQNLIYAGAEVATVYGIDEAIAQLENWGLVRGKAKLSRGDDPNGR